MDESAEIIVRNSKLKYGLITFYCLIFFAGTLLILYPDLTNFWPSLFERINANEKGWAIASCLPFSGIGMFFGLWGVLDRRVHIQITKEHLFLRRNRFFNRSLEMYKIPWSLIDSFLFHGLPYNKSITLKLAAPCQNLSAKEQDILHKLTALMTENDLVLGASNYDHSPRDIYHSLKEFHQRATQKTAP